MFTARSKRWTWETQPLPKGYQLILVPSELDVQLLLSSPCCNGFLLSSSRVCDPCGQPARSTYAQDLPLSYQCRGRAQGSLEAATAEGVAAEAGAWYESVLLTEVDPLAALLLRQELEQEFTWLRARQLELIREWAREGSAAESQASRPRLRDYWGFASADERRAKQRKRGYAEAVVGEERAWQKLLQEHRQHFG